MTDFELFVERLDQVEVAPIPGCWCELCTLLRQDNLTADLNKKYGTAAEVLQRLARMD